MSFRKFSLLGSVCLLAACANIEETSIQPITVETPGAAESRCYLTVDGFRYPVTPPQTLNISKSDKDLLVECVASGNRHQAQVIHPVMSKYGQAEAVTGNVPALAWDFWSDSLYKYPDIVTVDFSHAPTMVEGLPAQNATDVKQPEEYNLEEKVGGWPQRVSDKYAKAFPLVPRDKPGSDDQQMIQTGGNAPDKGDLHAAAPATAVAAPGAATAATPATAAPAPAEAPTSGKTGLKTMPPSPHAADTPVSTVGAPAPIPSTPQPTAPAAPPAGGTGTVYPAPATSAPPQGPSVQGAAGPAPPPGPSPAETPEGSATDYIPGNSSSVFVNPDAPASGAPTPLYPGQ